MQAFQHDFIEYALSCDVLRFGDFTLKSGRRSPYFFNTGLFDSGARIGRLGRFYAQALQYHALSADVIYGPAYKGIPLACATAIALAEQTGREIPFAFNRKEAKDHGEGGLLVGAPLKGRVLIIDDVITAGTSVRESVEIIRGAGAQPSAVLIALDRQEQGQGALTAVQEVEQTFGLRVYPIIALEHIVAYLEQAGREAELAPIRAYRARYASG
ncbi:MAG: orotate phosphoribosyltransferase [Gammaproteobacteria bacterium]|nr:orotate phosphoribosyltransferase [Gammaproteobacteria bacterium]